MTSQSQKRKIDEYNNRNNEFNHIVSSSSQTTSSSFNDVEHRNLAAPETQSIVLEDKHLADLKRPGTTTTPYKSALEIDPTFVQSSANQEQSYHDDSSLFDRLQAVAGVLPGPPSVANASVYSTSLQNQQQRTLPVHNSDSNSTTTTNFSNDMYNPHRMFPEQTNAAHSHRDALNSIHVPVEYVVNPNDAYRKASLQNQQQQQQQQSFACRPCNSHSDSSVSNQDVFPSFNHPRRHMGAAEVPYDVRKRQDLVVSCNALPQQQQVSSNGTPHFVSRHNFSTASARLGVAASPTILSNTDDSGLRMSSQQQQLQQQQSSITLRLQQDILESMRPFNGIHATTTVFPPPTPGILLARPTEDAKELSEYQCMIRLHLEVFACTKEDTISYKTQGRRRQLVIGQIAVRCRHCSFVPYSARGSGSAYFPSSLKNLYQAAQNMASTHLHHRCSCIPMNDRQQLIDAQQRTYCKGSKEYWIECCTDMGIIEAKNSNDDVSGVVASSNSSATSSYLKFSWK